MAAMLPTVRHTSLAFVVAGLLLACDQTIRTAGGKGQMSIQWSGSGDGNVTAPATATWCEVQRLLEIRSIRGDTGIALAVYPTTRPTGGSYRIVEPAKAESMPPAAGVAVRWLTRNAVQGFRGDSGQLELERSSTGQLSGRVHARARSVVDTQRIVVTGTFRDLLVQPDSLGCEPEDSPADTLPDEAAEDPDTGVH